MKGNGPLSFYLGPCPRLGVSSSKMNPTFDRNLYSERSWRPKFQRTWHDNIIDLLLTDPTLTQKEVAARLGRNATTINCVMASDMFKARYEARRLLMNETLAQAITGKLTRLAIDAIEVTHEKLKLQRDKLPFEDLVDVTDKTLSRLGYGMKTAANPAVVINNNQQVVAPISADELEAIRSRLRAEQAKVVEGAAAETFAETSAESPALGGGPRLESPSLELAAEVGGAEESGPDEGPPAPELEQL